MNVPRGWSTAALCTVMLSVLLWPSPSSLAGREDSYTLFESGQVRPLALSPDGQHLFAANTPDNRLEIFRVTKRGLRPLGSVTVGLEPVAVAARSNKEVWVVNHLSDSVSIVDVSNVEHARVVRTLLVGDEPRDIVFAGARGNRAFITTAHRGQNSPIDPQFTTPGVGRADVWVFDADNLGASLGGDPLTIVTLFTDTPRALAVTPDGSRVYAAGFHTGNRTTSLFVEVVQADPRGLPPTLPSTREDKNGEPQPDTGLIVQFNGQAWVDNAGREWSYAVRFSLPDKDVFVIDANANPPAALAGPQGYFTGVGTVLFNMAVNPVNGVVYVSNTDALNLKRFEGQGLRLGRDHTVQGHLHESRITVLGTDGVRPRHLNKHIDYSRCCATIPNDENATSLAQPMGMAVTRDGKTLYVAAFGSSKIGVFKTAALEDDTFVPDRRRQIAVTGGGPSGLVLDEENDRLFVLTRFDNAIAIVDLSRQRQVGRVPMFNPEPQSVVKGRRFLFDASFTSSHGDTSCGVCHVFGDFDSLAWDLGDPDGTTIANPGPFALGPSLLNIVDGSQIFNNPHFRALKGPMTTQSLRGLANHGSMHWRGDRTGGNDEPTAQPDSGSFNEDLAFKKFNVAFVGLNGRHAPLNDEDMQAFTDFALQITYPPNPTRNLDNSLTDDQAAARAMYFGAPNDMFRNCHGCHVLDPDGNRDFGVAKPGFFGADGKWSTDGIPQIFKVPHFRNVYQKVGMFGMPFVPFFPIGEFGFMGDQVRGFGFAHDGAVDTLFRVFSAAGFIQRPPLAGGPFDPGNPGGFPFMPPDHPLAPVINPIGDRMRRQMESFLLAFDTNLAPIVGQQVTLTPHNAATVSARIALLTARADAAECELVVKGHWGRERGWLYIGGGKFLTDRAHEHPVSDAEMRSRAREHDRELTYTCVPPGSGRRIALDRDLDGQLDRDE